MAQDLKSISLEAFQLQLYKIPSPTLVQIGEDIRQFKIDYGETMTLDEIDDIQRKETKVEAELIRRNYIKKHDDAYRKYYLRTNFKKKVW